MAKKQPANNLDAKTWMKYSVSIWSDLKPTREETRLNHPAMFPVALASRLIDCLTNQEDRLVLDPFCGVGSTLVAAAQAGKDSIGIDISEAFTKTAKERLAPIIPYNGPTQSLVCTADSRHLAENFPLKSVDLVITSPPYWDILLRKRKDGKEGMDYGSTKEDLGKIADYDHFLDEVEQVFRNVYLVLKPNKFCCVVVKDIRKGSWFYPLHIDLTHRLHEVGFWLHNLIVWDKTNDYNNLLPFGYPTAFYINSVHEYILIFKKCAEEKEK